ncbi:MAG: glycosyltransferase [Thermodesulfobacteriota bacterium]
MMLEGVGEKNTDKKFAQGNTFKLSQERNDFDRVYLPKVSVIVPVYNAEKTIAECINSLLRLNYPKENLELIFINNASTDRTENILNRYGEEIRILYEEKRGPSSARNKGLLNAGGDVVAFVDADCAVDKDWLKNIFLPLQDKSVGIVGGKILSKRPCNKIEEFGEKIHDHHKAINEFKPPYVITMNWSSRLSVLKEVSLFDESFIRCEDVDLSYRISQAGYKFVYKPEAIVYHSNEKTLSGLFKEGYLHGFHSIKALKVHKVFFKQFRHRRVNIRSYIEILSSFINSVLGENQNSSLCYFVFNSGKKLGKFFGSIRFLYLDL